MVFTDFRNQPLVVSIEGEVSICHLFEAQVRRQPTAPALEFMGQCWSYQTLNTYANQLAHYLRGQGVGPDVLVGLCLERSFEMIMVILAILKAGGAYVPLDPGYPLERLDWMLEDSQISLLITQDPLASSLPTHTAKLIYLKSDWPLIAQKSAYNPISLPALDDLAYVIYTSGSTGKPKGVMVNHRALSNFVQSANQAYGIVTDDRVLQFASISFDAAIEEIFLTLTQGATLVLRNETMLKSIPDFLRACDILQITVLDLPTAFWHQLCASLETMGLAPTVRLTIIGGERALPQWVTVWQQYVSPQVQLVNTYGPTESTVVATYCHLAGPYAIELINGEPIPIGQPLNNIQAHILDKDMKPVPKGNSGDLYLSGQSLAVGYLNSADLTADTFLVTTLDEEIQAIRLYKTGDLARYREDGQLEFLGRVDHQVKVRGFRVELQEIETLLVQHPAVQEAVVVVQTDRLGNHQLIAYVVNDLKYWNSSHGLCDRTTHDGNQLELDQIKQWQTIHNNDHLNTVNTEWDATFNISGWISSYTDELIPDIEMQEWIDNTVNRILQLKPKRILELGCGTGLLLFQIAPHCQSYIGADISDASLEHIKKQLIKTPSLASRIILKQRAADDFTGITPTDYDTVILNSVLQYFPSIDYLVHVLEQAIKFIKPGGSLFIGDVRNYRLQEALATSVELFKATNDLPVIDLWQRIQQRINREEELTIDPAFFLTLQEQLPQISQVQILLKQGHYHNELTQFRYDVVLHIGSTPQSMLETCWSDWQESYADFAKLRQQLQGSSVKAFGFRNIPNARLSEPIKIVNLLKQSQLFGNVADLRRYLAKTKSTTGVDPEKLRQLANELSYDIAISWPSTENNGSFNALFKPQCNFSSPTLGTIDLVPLAIAPPLRQPWHTYANNPLQAKITQTLSSQLRTYIAKKLPKYMVPTTFVTLERFPLNTNGKLDRKALPAPDFSRPELSVPFIAPQTVQDKKLASIWSDVLNISSIGINDSFFELGGDSLRMMQLISQIERSFKLTFNFTDFFKQPTIASLSKQLVCKQLEHDQKPFTATEHMSLSALETEASFNPISSSLDKHGSTPVPHWTNPQAILLTGATGFIGTSLLHNLLQHTDATVFCLVRAKNLTEGYQRLRQSLQQNLPNVDIPYNRIKPLMGNIAHPLLGLNKEKFEHLAKTVDVIYHSAASVNLFYPYGALKAANVIGTQSVLNLASHTRLKPVHYISTLDVFESLLTTGPSVIYEGDSIAQGTGIAGGYAQSKWVAEYLVTQAITAGIPACIYRPGMVTGHTQTGVCNPTDLMCRFFSSLMHLKSAPNLDWMIDMTPVDYVSQAIVHLSLQTESLNQTFHLINPNPCPLDQLVHELNKLGYAIKQVSYEQWQTKLNKTQNALSPLVKILTEVVQEDSLTRLEIWLAGTQMFDCQNTLKGLNQANINCPIVDSRLLAKYLAHISSW